jgi:hypothetical protein
MRFAAGDGGQDADSLFSGKRFHFSEHGIILLKNGFYIDFHAYHIYSVHKNKIIRTHLKNRILVQDRGGTEFPTGGILLYVEDFKRGTNKDIGPKDIFEIGSKLLSGASGTIINGGFFGRASKVGDQLLSAGKSSALECRPQAGSIFNEHIGTVCRLRSGLPGG